MLNPEEIKKILKENKITALKKFGQNFLVSQEFLDKIIQAGQIEPNDTILEVGPGLGIITFELAKKAKQVIAIEKDKKLFEILEKKVKTLGIKNVSLVNNDALVQRSTFNVQRYKLVANLPYNIAVAIIMNFLSSENPPQKIVAMVQKEVAQRIIAKPPHMNKLAVFCQLYAEPEIVSILPPSAFWPKPKVDSAILQLIPKNRVLAPTDLEKLEKIVNIGYGQPRKTLLNNLAKLGEKEEVAQWLLSNNVQPSQRPETLSIHNWLSLAKTIKTLHNN